MINSASVNFNKIKRKSWIEVNKYQFIYEDKLCTKIIDNKFGSEIIHYDINGKKTFGHIMDHTVRGFNFYRTDFITDINGNEHKMISKKNNELNIVDILPEVYKQYDTNLPLSVKLDVFGICINTSNQNTIKVYKETREIKIFNRKNKLVEDWKILKNGTIVLNNILEECIYVYYPDKDSMKFKYIKKPKNVVSYDLNCFKSIDLKYEYDEYGIVSSYNGINTKIKINDSYIEYLYPADIREIDDYQYKNILFYDKLRLDDNGNVTLLERIVINDSFENYI